MIAGNRPSLRPIAQSEMVVELGAARAAAAVMGIGPLLELVGKIARWFPEKRSPRADTVAAMLAEAEVLAGRASVLVPGSRCLHRAIACRLWLARRGIDAQVVVGFRKRAALEGHAWLEISTKTGIRTLFRDDADGYRESFREALV